MMKYNKHLNEMCALMAADAPVAYTDHNKWFDIYTDASDFQVGACIVHEDRPVAYFSHKLSNSQQNYTAMEKKCSLLLLPLKNLNHAPWCRPSCY